MTNSNDNCNFPIPNWFRRSLQSLLSPNQCLEDIFNQIGCLEFEESNEIKISDRVWGSKTMTLEKKKLKTLDMFLSKAAKIEICNHGSDDSVVYNHSSVSRHSNWAKNESHHDELSAKSIPQKESSKIDLNVYKTVGSINSEMDDESTEFRIKKSPTNSVDLFAEEVSTTSITSNSPKIPRKKKIEHSLSDEEIIPSSQTHENVSRFSLGSLSGYNNYINSRKSEQISSESEESCISQKENDMKQNLSISFNEQSLSTREDYSSEEEHQPISQLDSTKNSMKKINEVLTESDMIHENFGYGDLTEDDEFYILQCPTEVDTMNLEGVNLSLQGTSTVSFANEENNKYDCFSVKGNSKRCLYIALLDADKEEMKIGIYPLTGNVILSENFEIPCAELFTDNCGSSNQSRICNNESASEELMNTSGTSDEKPRKKKRKIDGSEDEAVSTECFELFTDESPDKLFSKKKKKKKKHKNTEDGAEDEAVSTECFEPLTDESPDKIVPKKKRKKHKITEDETWNEAALNRYFSQKATEEVLERFVSKKKKKKHTNTESNRIKMLDFNEVLSIKTELEEPQSASESQGSNMMDLNQVLSIKTELEEQETVSESQETPSKSRKRKRKDREESRESIEEDKVPKKKKKQKHSHQDSLFMMSPSQE